MVDHSVTRALMPGPEARHPGDGTCPYPSPASGGGWTTAVALPCTIGQRDGFRPGTSHCVGAHTPSGVPSRLLGPEVPHPCAKSMHRGYRSALPLQARPTPHPGTGRPFQLPTAPRSSGSPPSMGSHRARWPVMAVVCATLPTTPLAIRRLCWAGALRIRPLRVLPRSLRVLRARPTNVTRPVAPQRQSRV